MALTPFFKKIATGITVFCFAILFAAFTQKADNQLNLSEVCFEFTGDDIPDALDATNPENYMEPENDCLGIVKTTLCRICFDVDQFPLTIPAGLPDFSDLVLKALVADNMGNPGNDGATIYAPAPDGEKWIKLHFREEQ